MDEEETQEIFEHCNPDHIDLNEDNPKKELAKSLLRKIDLPTAKELREKIRCLDPYQREVLNVVLKYGKDLVKSRKLHNKVPVPPLYMMHGGAGAGKSTVIRLTAQWFQRLVQWKYKLT